MRFSTITIIGILLMYVCFYLFAASKISLPKSSIEDHPAMQVFQTTDENNWITVTKELTSY